MRRPLDLSLALLLATASACAGPSPQRKPDPVELEALPLIPWPRSVTAGEGWLVLPGWSEDGGLSQAFSASAGLEGMLQDWSFELLGELWRAAGPPPSTGARSISGSTLAAPQFFLQLDDDLGREAYRLEIDDAVRVTGSTPEGVRRGLNRVLALMRIGSDGSIELPRLRIEDAPEYPYRGLMLDVARVWHPIEVLYDAVDLCALYQVRYLHLHLSDDQSFTFESLAFPELASLQPDGSPRHYSQAELRELVAFADARGVTLVPEIDVPAHASVLVGARPDLFGTTDAGGTSRSTRIVNMANERAYPALETLLAEVADVFASSPYLHFGADEVGAGHLRELPEYAPFCAAHGLTAAAAGDTGELYQYFVGRVAAMIQGLSKRPVAWEGFRGSGTENAPIPRDLLIMAWQLQSNLPEDLIDAGFEIVNAGWWPLYVVPPQTFAPFTDSILDWDPRQFARRETQAEPVTLPAAAPVIGAQMSMWEQRPEAVIPLLRDRLGAFAERAWGPSIDAPPFEPRFAAMERVLDARGLTASPPAEPEPAAFRYRLHRDLPYGASAVPADLSAYPETVSGTSARVTPARMTVVNDALFAKVQTLGHVDTRVENAWNTFALELEGQLEIPAGGDWTFQAYVGDGAAELWIGGVRVASSASSRRTEWVGPLPAGRLPFRIAYVFSGVQNELNLRVLGPGMAEPIAFEDLVVDLFEHDPDAESRRLPEGIRFDRPGLAANRNLTTGRPVTVTGGHQGPNVPERAVDGDLSNDSGWHCGSSPESLTVDLEQPTDVERVRVVTYHDGSRYYQYTVSGSLDGETWTELVNARDNGRPASPDGYEHRFEPTPVRFLRLELLYNSANPGVHVNEFMAW